jgi:hypothetical protein
MKKPLLVVLVPLFHAVLFNSKISSADDPEKRIVSESFTTGFVQGWGSNRHRQSSAHKSDTRHRKLIEYTHLRPSSTLFSRPQDSLVSGLSFVSFASGLGVLWSEYAIILTGCGPINFSDSIERICYQGVILSAGVALFTRIVTGGMSLEVLAENTLGPMQRSTLIQVRVAEVASALAVLGAFLALGLQEHRGTNIDGLSGIDIDMCRAIRDISESRYGYYKEI